MLQNILDMLDIVKGGSEEIEFAKGKHYLPQSWKETFKQIKEENQWPKR